LHKLIAKQSVPPPKEQKFPYHLFIDIFNDNKTESDLATDDLSTEVDNNYQPFIFGVPVKDDINIKADIDDKNNFTIGEENKLDSPNSHSPLNTPIDQEQERENLIFNNWSDNTYYNQQKDDNSITNNNQSNNKITSRRNSLSINNIITFNELQEEYNKLLVKRQNITDKIIDTEDAFVNENTKYRKLNSASSICKLDLSNMDSMYKKLTNLLLKTQIAVNSLDGNIDEWQHDIRDLVNVELKEVIKCFNEHNDLSQKYNYNDSYKNLVAIDNKMKAPNRESLEKMHQLFLDFLKAIELCKEEIESYSNQLKSKALDINDINNDIICYEESLSAIDDNLISLNKDMSELARRFKK
ncbi:MAG: hypothetical protein HRU35_06350, partial [Rickettsiaceae bacterium]|nr:hypothetical protein [Rickettsiaceae bacterium]